MKDIAIYGAGGLGREVACLLRRINEEQGPTWNLIGYFDDGKEIGMQVGHFGKVLGGNEELNAWNEPLNVVLAFGSPKALKSVSEKITNQLITFPNIIAPDFVIADPDTFKIGKGNVITFNCGVSTSITIGDFNLFNGSVAFGHDVTIGAFNVFMPGTRISGEVRIGDRCVFGSGSFVKQQLEIPDGVTLSPLSPLLTKPKADTLYIGNPARKFRFE